ncbi:MAG TPA: septum formation initiator family protein [Candidatus Babeliales bacterium]|nr:septum formation initiator family protein [Candidatus Babeliales bacterium]
MTSKELKKNFLRFFLGIEVLVFGLTYFWGAHGLRALVNMNQSNIQLEIKLNRMQNEVGDLESQIEQWHIHPFYREKIAREKLQMAKNDDTIYFIDEKKS